MLFRIPNNTIYRENGKNKEIKYNHLLKSIFENVIFLFWCINDVRGSAISWWVRNTMKHRYGSF